ncbi:Polysaccharide deacetylase [Posidoniimonas corsicana]|uniref:Polysaccharide deacetylase n=1 Tax=Posidoniimonas corsicana TaxID=1938618 RepID=A0A5C5VCL6_9BACT|nr:polysaccharide deacetylase family protein [Posidoniimonas corsicana]TWT36364.1 Polysaccharide deacetylase [Posidoniimonas corsicana]
MRKPLASLSLDLDNKWAYLRTLGPGNWEHYPCYLDVVAPRVVAALERFDLRMTVFVVGKDLESESGRDAVCQLAEAGCEIGNHTYNHYPWLQTLPRAEQRREILDAHDAIRLLTGAPPRGFRGPGFSNSAQLLGLLTELDYAYDSSSLPAATAPLARMYCAANSLWSSGPRGQMFGSWTDAFRPLRPHRIDTPYGGITELPVTTMPLLRTPIHMTYLAHLAQYSRGAAAAYLQTAARLCKVRGVAPSLLLHPLDFMGAEDDPELTFLPGMRLPGEAKWALLVEMLERFAEHFELNTVAAHAGLTVPPLGREDTIAAVSGAGDGG